MIRALIFDFNGVLADDDPIHMEAFRQVAGEEGLSFTDEEYLDTYLPLNDRDCFRLLFEKHSRPLAAAKLAELIERKGGYYFRAIGQKAVLFAEAAGAVRTAAGPVPAGDCVGSPQKRNLAHSRAGSTAWLLWRYCFGGRRAVRKAKSRTIFAGSCETKGKGHLVGSVGMRGDRRFDCRHPVRS